MKIIIVGGGRVGYYLAESLRRDGHETVVIERDREQSRVCANLLDVTVCCGDGTSQETLRAAGAADADVVAAVMGRDESNLVCCQTAKKIFGVKKTVAKVNDPKNVAALRALGVDTVVSATDHIIQCLEREVDISSVKELLELSGGTATLLEITLPEEYRLAGTTLMELALPVSCNIVCINRGGNTIIPRGQTKLHSGDILLVVALSSIEKELRRALKLK